MASSNLLDEHHVMRHVPWSKLRKDADDNVLGFLPTAFQLREDEDTLSLTWLEFFDPGASRREKSVWAMRKERKLGSKSAFGVANVGHVKKLCSDSGARIRILHEPEPNNGAHAVIRRLPTDDMSLLAALAEDAFTELIHNTSIRSEPS